MSKFISVLKNIFFVFYLAVWLVVFVLYTLAYPLLKRRYDRTKNPNHYPNKILWTIYGYISRYLGVFIR